MAGHSINIDDFGRLVGEEIGVSQWYVAGQHTIDLFADLTHDRQAIHVDPEAATKSPFGGTIAHGFFSLSLLSAMFATAVPPIDGVRMGINYGFNSVRFLAPVRTGKSVRGRFTLKSLNERTPGQWHMVLGATVEIQGEDKPALVAEWLVVCVTGANET